MSSNIKEFEADLRQYAEEWVPEQADLFIRKVGLETWKRVRQKSPVDRGRFRGSWTLSWEDPDTDVLPPGDHETPDQPLNGEPESRQQNPFGMLFLNNQLPYAAPLERGHSDQAPDGVLEVSVSEIESELASRRPSL